MQLLLHVIISILPDAHIQGRRVQTMQQDRRTRHEPSKHLERLHHFAVPADGGVAPRNSETTLTGNLSEFARRRLTCHIWS